MFVLYRSDYDVNKDPEGSIQFIGTCDSVQ